MYCEILFLNLFCVTLFANIVLTWKKNDLIKRKGVNSQRCSTQLVFSLCQRNTSLLSCSNNTVVLDLREEITESFK